jgi:hypothetical protein
MPDMSNFLKSFVADNVKMIVDYVDEVNVDVITSTKNVIIQIKVNELDHGKVIGRKGNTIQSLKVLTAAVKNTKFSDKRKVFLELLECVDSDFSYNK